MRSPPSLLLSLVLFSGLACLAINADDPLRPQFHVMPPRYWMNDPNGPAFYNGVYHLFYQHNPESIAWTNIHWGHAVSKDLVFWQHLPIALSPGPETYDLGGVWSGSISIDPTTGVPTIYYTGASPQVQCMASPANLSDPLLTKWTKTASNPFLRFPPPDFPQDNFRDPTTAWKSVDGLWYLLIGSGNDKGGAALLYRSKSGTFTDIEYAGHPLLRGQDIQIDGSIWECPDFYPLHSNNASVWVLKVSSWALGIGDHYYIGQYNQRDQTFTSEAHNVYDYGRKFYASKSFLDTHPAHPEPRQILWAWINEADDRFPQRGWAGVQGLPRHISLDTDGTFLIAPIPELSALRLSKDHKHFENVLLKAGTSFPLSGVEAVQVEILVKYQFVGAPNEDDNPSGSKFGLHLLQSQDKREQTDISVQGGLPPTKATDLPGGDYRSLQVKTNDYLACEAACNHDLLCHAWTLILGMPERDNCWLKSSIPNSQTNPQTISGAKPLLQANRTLSSLYPRADSFAESGPLQNLPSNHTASLHIFVDHSIIEVFANGGRQRLTTRVYPTLADSRFAEVFAEGHYDVRILAMDVWQLRLIW